MTTKRDIDRRLSELEDDETSGEPIPLCNVIAACEKGVDPVEEYGGYVPEEIVRVLHDVGERSGDRGASR